MKTVAQKPAVIVTKREMFAAGIRRKLAAALEADPAAFYAAMMYLADDCSRPDLPATIALANLSRRARAQAAGKRVRWHLVIGASDIMHRPVRRAPAAAAVGV